MDQFAHFLGIFAAERPCFNDPSLDLDPNDRLNLAPFAFSHFEGEIINSTLLPDSQDLRSKPSSGIPSVGYQPALKANTQALRKLARVSGFQPSYKNCEGKVVWASNQVLKLVLEPYLKTSLQTTEQIQAEIERQISILKNTPAPATLVLWQNADVNSNAKIDNLKFHWISQPDEKILSVKLSSDETSEELVEITPLQNELHRRGRQWTIVLPQLQIGYYQIQVTSQLRSTTHLLIVAPDQIKTPGELQNTWGSFLPMSSLRSNENWGIGDLSDLEKCGKQLKQLGCSWLGQLPLLPGRFESQDCDPSPYSSLSRLFWNEIYLDVDRLARESQSVDALKIIDSPGFQRQLEELRQKPHVDFFSVYQLKKQVLQVLSQEFFAAGHDRTKAYQDYLRANPDLISYSQFRSGELPGQQLHQYAQFQMNQHIKQLTESDISLYMDFPVGVNDSGYDFHHYRDQFFAEVSVGAPPEPVFQKGQDWGFPSLHPRNSAKDQHRYFRRCLQHHMKHSKILRLDHVMGLYRAYVIPKGHPATDGVYIRFPQQDLFAIACIEAHRTGTDLIGENLGTVPEQVNQILRQRNFKGMQVGQFMIESDVEKLKNRQPTSAASGNLLCLNNHDMPSFTSYCLATDLQLVADLKIMDPSVLPLFQKNRLHAVAAWKNQMLERQSMDDQDLYEFLVKVIEFFAMSKVEYFIFNPEDAWLETEAFNIPGTYKEFPNWTRKHRFLYQDWLKQPAFQKIAQSLIHRRGK